jgi:hypothetical protein
MKLKNTDIYRTQVIIDPKELEVIVIDDGVYYFKPVPDFDGYFATTCGRIISTKRRKPILLKPFNKDKTSKYLHIKLNRKTKKLHRVIASAFLYASTQLCRGGQRRLEVNHIDGDPTNNKVANLEIVSRKENMQWNIVLEGRGLERLYRNQSAPPYDLGL